MTTRTRGSRCAAGSGGATVDTSKQDASGAALASDDEPAEIEAPETLHVPIKRKGSRKR